MLLILERVIGQESSIFIKFKRPNFGRILLQVSRISGLRVCKNNLYLHPL